MPLAPARRFAFTLIELLVVVSIIALLIAILLPSLANARRVSQRAQCAANLHGLGRGMLMYETEYNVLPISYRGIFTSGRDIDVTRQYLRSEPTWNFPRDQGTIHWTASYIGGVHAKILNCPAVNAQNPFDMSATPGATNWFDALNGAIDDSNNFAFGNYQIFVGDVGNNTGVANRFNYYRDQGLATLYSGFDSTPKSTRSLPPQMVLMQDLLWKDAATDLFWVNHTSRAATVKPSYQTTSTIYANGILWIAGFNVSNDLANADGANVLTADGSAAFRKTAELTVIYQKNNFAGGTLSYTMYTGGPP